MLYRDTGGVIERDTGGVIERHRGCYRETQGVL